MPTPTTVRGHVGRLIHLYWREALVVLALTVTACIPLNVDGEITGIIVLFRLLSHKVALEPADIELLEVLSQHVGTALYATRAPRRLRGARS